MKAYVVAIVTTALISLVRIVFHESLGDVAPLGPYLILVVIVAGMGGLKPGLFATLLGAACGTFLLVPPYYSWVIHDHMEAIGVTVYLIVGVVVSTYCELLHGARRRAEAAEVSVRQLHRELADRVDELQELDAKKDEFLAILAHELRNPLAPLRTGLEVLRLSPAGRASPEPLAIMERQLGQLVRLVDDLFDVSRFSRGKVELRRERVELVRVIAQAVETSRPLVEAGRHSLAVHVPPEPLYVDADVTRLAQVFANLLNNSAKYTEPCGAITLTVAREGNQARIRVQDTGVGLPEGMLEQVFEMFTQVDRAQAKSLGGLGIGLSLVKRLVELHGGSVTAYSDGPGKGSEFTVRVPLAAPPANHEETAAPEAVPSTSRRVLVVDDNHDVARSLALLLQAQGHETRTVFGGQEALAEAQAWRPDVILLDIGMPQLSGHDVCRRLRQEEWGREMVLVAVTGWGQSHDRQRSEDAGFDVHLVKPVDIATLRRVLVEIPRSENATA